MHHFSVQIWNGQLIVQLSKIRSDIFAAKILTASGFGTPTQNPNYKVLDVGRFNSSKSVEIVWNANKLKFINKFGKQTNLKIGLSALVQKSPVKY